MARIVELAKTSPFLRNNAIFMVGSLGVAALNYLFYPILGRLLPPANFGEVQALASLFTQAAIFFTILTYVTIHVTVNVTDIQKRNQTLLGLEKIAMIVGYSLLAVALICVDYLRAFLNFHDVWPFVALVVALAFSIPLAFRMAFLRGRQQFLRASVTDGVGSAVKLLLAPLFVVIGWGTLGAVGALAISQVIALGVGLAWARQAGFHGFAFGPSSRLDVRLLRPYMKHALAILVGAGGVTIIQTIDVITVKHFFSPTEAGYYAGITTIAAIVYFLMSPILGVLITSVSINQTISYNQSRLKASLGLMVLVGGSALLVMTMFPEFVISILVGPKYLVEANLLPKLGVSMLLLALANAFMMYHIALKRYIYSLASVVVCVIVLALMTISHDKLDDVINNIILGSLLLLIITIMQNFHFYYQSLREDNA